MPAAAAAPAVGPLASAPLRARANHPAHANHPAPITLPHFPSPWEPHASAGYALQVRKWHFEVPGFEWPDSESHPV